MIFDIKLSNQMILTFILTIKVTVLYIFFCKIFIRTKIKAISNKFKIPYEFPGNLLKPRKIGRSSGNVSKSSQRYICRKFDWFSEHTKIEIHAISMRSQVLESSLAKCTPCSRGKLSKT